MDLLTLLASTIIAGIVGASVGYFFQRRLAARQSGLNYEYQARLRLHEAVGPLRFQLVVACRDVERRISGHVKKPAWNLPTDAYYGSSTIFRLLRPLAVCAVIEKQMNAADFSVDPVGVELLQFETSAYTMLTGDEPLPGYGGIDWAKESQHVFADNLRRAALRLVRLDHDGKSYVIDFAEFRETYPRPRDDAALAGLARIIADCGDRLWQNSVFWVRLVGYAYTCTTFVEKHGSDLGFTPHPIDVVDLVGRVPDPDIRGRAGDQEAVFAAVTRNPL